MTSIVMGKASSDPDQFITNYRDMNVIFENNNKCKESLVRYFTLNSVHVLVAIVVTLLAPWVPSQEYEPPLVLGEHKLGVDLLLQTGNNQLRVI